MIAGVFISMFTEMGQAPPLKVFWVSQVCGFYMSLVWIYALANIIVDAFLLYEVISGVSSSLLGLTLLAWGSSIGDVFAFISLSKRGFGEMAMTGCMAAPLFKLLLGLGITTIHCSLQLKPEYTIHYSVHEFGSQVRLSILTLCSSLLTCAVLIVAAALNDFRLTKGLAYGLFALYTVIICVMVELS